MPKTKTESVFRSVLFSRRKIAVFGLCLVISTLFWVLLAFNEIYTTTITVPVRYVNMPEDQMLIDRLPAEVELEISGVGYRLLSYSLQPETAEITLDGMLTGINPGSKNAEAFLATNGAVLFFNRLHNDVEALRVEPDTIHFTFFKRAFRKVPVHLKRAIAFHRQYHLSDSIRLSPDSINITGPAELVDSITHVETEPLILNNLSSSGEYTLKIKQPGREISFAPGQISAELHVEKFTEKVIELPITVDHLLSRDSIQILPERAKITFQVSLSDYQKATAEQFRLSADAMDLRLNTGGRLRLYIRKFPVFISNVKIEPESVEFIIRKKK